MSNAHDKMREKMKSMSAEDLLSKKKEAPEGFGSKIKRANNKPIMRIIKMILGVGYGDVDSSHSAGSTSSEKSHSPRDDFRGRVRHEEPRDRTHEEWLLDELRHESYQQLVDGKGDRGR